MLSALAGGRLLGARYGSQPARVVALHGWRRSHTDFAASLEGLDAVVPDLPGFGASAPPDGPWGSVEYAEAVLPLCREGASAGEAVVLVGHSFGGRVAVQLAAEHPDAVAALVLTGTPLWRPAGSAPPKSPAAYRVARALHRLGILSDARMEERRRRFGSEDYRQATGVMRDVLVRSIGETNDGTYRRALEKVTCPVELVWGELDTAAPLAVAREAAERHPGATLTALNGVGHMTPVDAPAAIRAAIDRHVAIGRR